MKLNPCILGRMRKFPHPEPRLGREPPRSAAWVTGEPRRTIRRWDRLGRIAQQRWQNDSGTVKDRFDSGYDISSNRKWRENTVTTGKSELYTYDRLNRLTKAERGDLNGNRDAISSTNFRQDWLLSAVGNWDRFRTDTDGGDPWQTTQNRAHNKANEITAIDDANAHLAYDLAGNMTKVPRPCDEANHHYVCTYDAWNRLVKVQDEAPATIAEYRYDGLNRRIAKLLPNGQNWKRTDFFYNEAWQVVEERYNDSQADSSAVATVTRAWYVWSGRYVDAPVCRFRDTTGDGNSDETLYYLSDAAQPVPPIVVAVGSYVKFSPPRGAEPARRATLSSIALCRRSGYSLRLA
jgi:YD repeat-containing protein